MDTIYFLNLLNSDYFFKSSDQWEHNLFIYFQRDTFECTRSRTKVIRLPWHSMRNHCKSSILVLHRLKVLKFNSSIIVHSKDNINIPGIF